MHLLWFDYLSMILDPFVLVAAIKKVVLNCGLSVCANDSISMIEGYPNNELLELLKTKKHARIFVHMLKYFENENQNMHTVVRFSSSSTLLVASHPHTESST